MVDGTLEPVEAAFGDQHGQGRVAVEGTAEDQAVEHQLHRLVPLRDTELPEQHHVAGRVRPRGIVEEQ